MKVLVVYLLMIFPREFAGFFSRGELNFEKFAVDTTEHNKLADFIEDPKDVLKARSKIEFNTVSTILPPNLTTDSNSTVVCGVDNSGIHPVYEGTAYIETYPWLGVLYYPIANNRLVTTVVLVSKTLVIASAADIHKMPKKRFRERARVVLGTNCTQPALRIKEYSFHPHYRIKTTSTIALIQLNLDGFISKNTIDLRPICAPPVLTKETRFYATVLNEDCKSSKLKIYEMDYVSLGECKRFYETSGLDVKSLWPSHTACGRARHGGECVWRDGAVLTVKQKGFWHLLGFGVYGPGCQAPARFIDYSVTNRWVKTAIARTGWPAVYQAREDEIVVRRVKDKIQRFGTCEWEELVMELYTDRILIKTGNFEYKKKVRYNMTIFSEFDYSCIIFTAAYPKMYKITEKPRMSLSFYCKTDRPICYQAGLERIDFYVEIQFISNCLFKMSAYGQRRRVIDVKKVVKHFNMKKGFPEIG